MEDDPGLRAVDVSGKQHSPVDPDASLLIQVFVVPNAFVSSANELFPFANCCHFLCVSLPQLR